VLVAGCDSPKEREAKYVEHGKELYDSGDIVKAALEFKNALQINPAGTEAQYYLGLIAEKQNDLAGAAAAFQRVADSDSKNFEAHVKAGQYALLGGDSGAAKRYADDLIAIAPGKPDGHTLKAAALMMEGKLPEAEKEANAALAVAPNNADAMVVLASQKIRSSDAAGAMQLIDRGLSDDPDNKDLLLFKLRVLYDQHRTNDVIAVLRRLHELDPANGSYAVDLANQLAASGDGAGAESTFKQALEANQDSDAVLAAYAHYLLSQRSRDQAIQEIKSLADRAKNRTKYLLLLEQLYIAASRLDDAAALMTDLQQNATVANDRLKAQVELARIAFLRGQKPEALDQVDAVLKEDAQNESALLLRGAMMLDTAKFDDAIADARSVLRNDINSIPGLTILAKAYQATGEQQLAIDTLRNLVRLAPNNLDARLQLASLLAAKSPDDAIQNLDAAIALRPDAVELQVQKAEYLIQTGSPDKAELIAQELAKNPKTAGVAHRILGEAALARSDYAGAISELDQAQTLGQPFSRIGPALVSAYVRSGKAADADKLLNARISAGSQDVDAMVLLAELHAQKGELGDAEDILNKAMAQHPDNSKPYLDLARVLTRENKLNDAAKILAGAAAKFPQDRDVARYAAITYDTIGNFASAKAGYEAILAKWPDDMVAANNLAALIADQFSSDPAQLGRARQLAEKFRNSDQPELLDTLGWVLVRQGNFDDATILLEKAASLAPSNQQIQFHYAVALKSKGLTAKAKEAFDKALAGSPTYRGVEEARKDAALQ
jgi:tetratricopeptide (TPR) repeat protein